jgi:hypothetical protein
MIRFLASLMLITFASCGTNPVSSGPGSMSYEKKLMDIKQHYPFDLWRQAYAGGLLQYTEENCRKMRTIFDDLISGLIGIGEGASENDKVKLFQRAIERTNALNDENNGTLIETGEREDLCELTNLIGEACGIDPKKYGDGEGLATEWRDW